MIALAALSSLPSFAYGLSVLVDLRDGNRRAALLHLAAAAALAAVPVLVVLKSTPGFVS